MQKFIMGLSLFSLIACSGQGIRDLASVREKGDKKIWTCAVLQGVERVETITEAKDRLEIYKSKEDDQFKFAGFGILKGVNSVSGQGFFKLESESDDGELYKNSHSDSLKISIDCKSGPESATFHVNGTDFAILCQET